MKKRILSLGGIVISALSIGAVASCGQNHAQVYHTSGFWSDRNPDGKMGKYKYSLQLYLSPSEKDKENLEKDWLEIPINFSSDTKYTKKQITDSIYQKDELGSKDYFYKFKNNTVPKFNSNLNSDIKEINDFIGNDRLITLNTSRNGLKEENISLSIIIFKIESPLSSSSTLHPKG